MSDYITPAPTRLPASDLFGCWTDTSHAMPPVGQKVIVCGTFDSGKRWRSLARWQPKGTIDASFWDDPPEDWWNNDETECTNPTDEWMEDAIEAEVVYGLTNVTHWMPLPPLPDLSPEPNALHELPPPKV